MARHMQRTHRLLGGAPAAAVALLVMVLLTACQPLAMPEPADQPADEAEAANVELTDEQAALTAALLDDMAAQTGAAPDEVEVVAVEEVTWPDASLGCPQPDMVYAQVLTPGYRITLQYNDAPYVYHTGQGADAFFILCEAAQ